MESNASAAADPAGVTLRRALWLAALLLALVKSTQFAIDSQALFSPDSGGYIRHALGLDFISYRSYVYGGLIRVFAVPFHSLRAIVGMQVMMGGVTAWLLAFTLMRYFHVRASIAIPAALVLAMDPVVIVHEHMVMTESASLLAMALFLTAALQYLDSRAVYWLAILSFLGVLLVSLRLVYLPVVLAAAVLLPAAACRPSARRPRLPALALAISCASMMLFQLGYQHLTGWLAHREPAYQYTAGFFLVAGVSPILKPGDSRDPRVAAAVADQSKSAVPFLINIRWMQLWTPDGLVARLKTVFGGDERAADQAARQFAIAAIRRNPAGFLWLGMRTYLEYWREFLDLDAVLRGESGMQPPHLVNPSDVKAISAAFGADVSNQDQMFTFSRRYQILAKYWYVFLLVAPFLAGLALALKPANPMGVALLLMWNLLLLASTCLGAAGSSYRYLQPFSFTGLATAAVICEKLAARARQKPGKI